MQDKARIDCYFDLLTTPLKGIEYHLKMCPQWYIKLMDGIISYILMVFIIAALIFMSPLFIITVLFGKINNGFRLRK